ncbi:MAG: DUF1203 domain-containing protein, partial [Pseudomonadota bacterium]|nr:DUF1203 domain-containing protein [Pseudomonadota bacterium]
ADLTAVQADVSHDVRLDHMAFKVTTDGDSAAFPAFLLSDSYILRGYSDTDRIVYGTGAVTATTDIPDAAETLLARQDVAYLHVRSAQNNCYHLRIEKAG